ncbi:hypothetical protein [Thalassobacterium sedimentorum]|nr:hypothetical protein [Coraliomargarita sp. SDUM461004]
MTASQRIQYLKLEEAIEEAQSDLKSGQYMIKTKASSLDPNRNVQEIIKRGEATIKRAQAEIESRQIGLANLLTEVEVEQQKQAMAANKRFNYQIESANYQDAIQLQTQQLLKTCWELGYETLFYDGLFIQDSSGTRRAETELRNQTYDALIDADGTKFSVTIPVDFKLKPETDGTDKDLFSYENAEIFKNDKKALINIELIHPANSSSGLLVLRAIDLKTQQITAHQLIKISNLAELLALESDNLEDKTPDQFELNDKTNTIEKLSQLSKPYLFEITESSPTQEVSELLTYTLLQNSQLQLATSDFIFRAYGLSLNAPENWRGQANAHIQIEVGDKAHTYQLNAVADGSDRILPSGVITLAYQSN